MKIVYASKEKGKWNTFIGLLESYGKSLDNLKRMFGIYSRVQNEKCSNNAKLLDFYNVKKCKK